MRNISENIKIDEGQLQLGWIPIDYSNSVVLIQTNIIYHHQIRQFYWRNEQREWNRHTFFHENYLICDRKYR